MAVKGGVTADGAEELRKARNRSAHLFAAVFLFSVFVNLLMLTGPIYMLQIYDRVLGSRSVETLTALTLLTAFLFAMMGVFDYARGRVIARAGARFQDMLDARAFNASLRQSITRDAPGGVTGLRHLEAIQRLFTSPAPMTFFDIPWTPLFVGVIFILHPWLGILALIGGGVLIVLTLIHQVVTRKPVGQAQASAARADRFADLVQRQVETVQSMGMQAEVRAIWNRMRSEALDRTVSASDRTGIFTTATKALRLFLQSAMLGLGAYLVLLNQLTPGAMIAGSILLGRALAPIEQGIGQWPLVQAAQRGWVGLSELLSEAPQEAERTPLPRPRARLRAEQITVMAPGENRALLRGISFEVKPGQALGVIGVSGSGKSTLARVLTGLVRPAMGTLRLDGATLDQYPQDLLGRYLGYVPQSVALLDGTIAQNIARMQGDADKARIVQAAKAANAHDLILKFPDGYDTWLPDGVGPLSGGQMQRIALARALYDDPVLVVLDEPNSNLDAEGTAALNNAIRALKAAERAVVIMAHRPAAIAECDVLLMLEGGRSLAFGPRDEVLARVLQPERSSVASIAPSTVRQQGGGGRISLDITRPPPSGPPSGAPPSGPPPPAAGVPQPAIPQPATRPDAGGQGRRPANGLSVRRPMWIGMLGLVVLMGGGGYWAFFTQIAGAVTASGSVALLENRQVVQHLDGGIVADLLAREGQVVEAGALLMRLDDSFLRTELSIIEGELFSLQARRIRLEAERDGADGSAVNHDPDNLIQTQDLEPWFEENSNLYLFSRDSFAATGARIGRKPILYPMNPHEAVDIDTPDDWLLAEALAGIAQGKGRDQDHGVGAA